ncbi:MAG: hypothetical protein ACM3KM_00475 [Acidobacteriaceae bacterium]
MSDFLKQDIFFFVTTVLTIVLGLLLAVLIVYLIRIGRRVDYIMDKAKQEVDSLSSELADFRKNVKASGLNIKHIGKLITHFTKKK